MKYILMMNTMRAEQGVPNWPRGDLRAHIAFMKKLNQDLHESGELVSAEGLASRGAQHQDGRSRRAAAKRAVEPRCAKCSASDARYRTRSAAVPVRPCAGIASRRAVPNVQPRCGIRLKIRFAGLIAFIAPIRRAGPGA